MEILINVLSVFFVFFLIYTMIFIVQWIIGFCMSIYRMEEYRERKNIVKEVFDDKIAENLPVSILVPAYNEQACICDTIESLLEEDYPNLEIIVVDDGSTDHTIETVVGQYDMKEAKLVQRHYLKTQPVLSFYEKKISGKTLKFASKKNGGKSDALNCGLNICTSPHCVILDADTKVQKGSIRNMRIQFLIHKEMIVCAGVVGNGMYQNERYKSLLWAQKALVLFQQLEYFRTFYMQRELFDRLNANVVVSGAFAMFDAELLVEAGGYKRQTIGEDMEITMRLHAFCKSQNRAYRIGYIPEVKCDTQVPFRYKDYYNQRRRWHIGMIQSLKEHRYMLGSKDYGYAGFVASTFIIFYELWSPIIEVAGVFIIFLSLMLGSLHTRFVIMLTLVYIILSAVTQLILVNALNCYGVEKTSVMHRVRLFLISFMEIIIFHPLNVLIKLNASITSGRHNKTWNHIEREDESKL